MAVFEFEKALESKGISKSELPRAIRTKLDTLSQMCKDLGKIPDEDEDEIEELSEKIEELDESIASEIDDVEIDPPADPPADPDPVEVVASDDPPADPPSENNNTLTVVAVLVGLGALAYGAMRFFGGNAKK